MEKENQDNKRPQTEQLELDHDSKMGVIFIATLIIASIIISGALLFTGF